MCDAQLGVLKALVADLEAGNLEALVADGRNGRLSLLEIREALSDYPGTLTPMPAEEYHRVHYYPRTHHEDTRGIAEIDLWYDSVRSDLTLSVEYVFQDGKWQISICDIHVL